MKNNSLLKKKMYVLLQEVEDARERKNKSKAVAVLIQRDFPKMAEIDRKLLANILERAETYDRYWRQILLDNENLRGKDYKSKKKVVQKKLVELGYSATHYQDKKLLEQL